MSALDPGSLAKNIYFEKFEINLFCQGKNHYIMYNIIDFLLNIHVVYLFDGLQFQHSHFYKREIGIA